MILIAGGTGTLGRQIIPLLTARGLDVRLLARHPGAAVPDSTGGSVEMLLGDVRDPETLARALTGVETVVSAITGFGGPDALGTKAVDREANAALISAARRAGVRGFVLLSVNQAAPDHPIELFRDKWSAEEALRTSGMGWTIIRPTAYLETWLGIIGGPLVATGRTRIFGRGRNPMNFVSAADVARFVDLAVADEGLRATTIEAPGPENLTLDQLAATVEAVTGRTGTKQHLAPAMMRIASTVMRIANPLLGAQIATALVMDRRDMTVDGPSVRSAFPSIPMTTASEVAARMFGSTAAAAVATA
jgi:uncharacterized protein YbjT (DUF2867 family)